MRQFGLAGLGFLAMAAGAAATILRVPGGYSTIQSAIDHSVAGDTVIVSPDVYKEQINFQGKAITVTSEDPNDPDIVAATVIEGTRGVSKASVVTFNHNETTASTLTGFTIRGGYGTLLIVPGSGGTEPIYWGAGVFCQSASPTIVRNRIIQNQGPVLSTQGQPIGYGGGIACFQSDAVIAYNTVTQNSSFVAGGIMTYIGNALVYNNVVYDNVAYIGGGAVLIGGRLINNTIVFNAAGLSTPGLDQGQGGNLYVVHEATGIPCQVKSNILCNARSGGGVHIQAALGDWFAFNNVWGNLPSDYQVLDPQTGAAFKGNPYVETAKSGNISDDPLFVDPEDANYRLQAESLCINGGDPNCRAVPGGTDLDGQPRIGVLFVDMGAYESPGSIRPAAQAGPDQTVQPGKTVTLDGSGSLFCGPGTSRLYLWRQVAGPPVVLDDPLSMHPSFVPQTEAQYRFQLLVCDGMYVGPADEVTITVKRVGR